MLQKKSFAIDFTNWHPDVHYEKRYDRKCRMETDAEMKSNEKHNLT